MKRIRSWFTLLNFLILMIPVFITLSAFGIMPVPITVFYIVFVLLYMSPNICFFSS